MNLEKDIGTAIEAGLDMRTRLIIWLSGAVLVILAGIGLVAWGEDRGAVAERVGWQAKELKERAADAALIEQHQQEMNDLELHHLLIERQTSEDHEQEISTLRRDRIADRADADRRGGLRIPAPACPPGGTVGGTEAAGAVGRDEPASTATVRLPEPVENDLWAIADDADEVSAQLRACQSWVRANGFYGPPVFGNQPLLDRMVTNENHHPEADQ